MLDALVTKYNVNPKELSRFLKFAAVGAIGAIIDFSILNVLIFWANWHYPIPWRNTIFDAGVIAANIVSTGMAILSNFTWNRLWTFPESRSRRKRYQLVQFTIVNLVGLLLNTAIFYLSYQFAFSPFLSKTISVQLAKAFAIGLVLFWNFFGNRIWTYRGL
ncbi:MAG: GtrA family protein [Anaerolineae bacterium]